MSIENISTVVEIDKHRKVSQIKWWSSRFDFLNAHNGIRPGKVHYLLGTTGTGKSTLMAAISADASIDSKILVILSEDTIQSFSDKVYQSNPKVDSSMIKIIHERSIPEEVRGSKEAIWAWIEMRIIEEGVRLVFWDNLTSSPLFSQRFGNMGQEWAVQKISEFSDKMEIAFFILMHTAKNVTDNMNRLIEGEDVRGTQQTFIGADFWYVFQRFSSKEGFFPFIRIVKHRGYNPKDRHFLMLFANGSYIKDKPITFEEINEVFLRRSILGRFVKEKK